MCVESYVPDPTSDEFCTVRVSTDPESSVVPMTRGNRTKNYDEVIMMDFLFLNCNATLLIMRCNKRTLRRKSSDRHISFQAEMTSKWASRTLQDGCHEISMCRISAVCLNRSENDRVRGNRISRHDQTPNWSETQISILSSFMRE